MSAKEASMASSVINDLIGIHAITVFCENVIYCLCAVFDIILSYFPGKRIKVIVTEARASSVVYYQWLD